MREAREHECRLDEAATVLYMTEEPTNAAATGARPLFDDKTPIYQQIADQIKDDILSGTLKEEDQVMSTNQYAAFYRINPATAAKAFQQLEAEGVLVKRRGIGMFVATGARETLRDARRARFFEERVDPIAREAEMLGIPVDALVERLRRKTGGQS